ncbi:MAG TPA: hypothetical protein VK253_06320, partial [Candidatus Binatia bacterium]|nr:hypothetical protein [Candidatus Binatia bacterium]
ASVSTIVKINEELITAYGYVAAVKGFSPERAPAFAVQLYIPTAPTAERLQWFSTDEIHDNRELVWVSLLRDAMVHSIPVALVYDGLRNIFSLELRSTVFYAEGEKATITGHVKTIAVDEFGLWKEDIDNPDAASIVICTPALKSLVLSFQSPNSKTKFVQLEMLQRAFRDNQEITLTYLKTPIMGKPDSKANVIVGVRIGQEPAKIPAKEKKKVVTKAP